MVHAHARVPHARAHVHVHVHERVHEHVHVHAMYLRIAHTSLQKPCAGSRKCSCPAAERSERQCRLMSHPPHPERASTMRFTLNAPQPCTSPGGTDVRCRQPWQRGRHARSQGCASCTRSPHLPRRPWRRRCGNSTHAINQLARTHPCTRAPVHPSIHPTVRLCTRGPSALSLVATHKLAAGTQTSSKTNSAVGEARMPHLSLSR